MMKPGEFGGAPQQAAGGIAQERHRRHLGTTQVCLSFSLTRRARFTVGLATGRRRRDHGIISPGIFHGIA